MLNNAAKIAFTSTYMSIYLILRLNLYNDVQSNVTHSDKDCSFLFITITTRSKKHLHL